MPGVFTLLILSVIGTLGARQPDIDINRIKRLPKEDFRFRTPTYHRRRSIVSDHYSNRNDYDYHSGRVNQLRAPVHLLHGAPSNTEAPTGTIHQPRQDPRAFYQSDAYIKETNRKNINNEVSSVYVERGEVQASEHNYRPVPIRFTDNQLNNINEDPCIRCPNDRMLVAKPGLDRALLLYPQLKTCAGRKVRRDAHFIHMYGPKFGSLVTEGSHMVVGRITRKGNILQTCKMQIHVLIQTCSAPKYLVSHCGDQNKSCTFTCRNPRHEILGPKILTCGEDMKWSQQLPVCRVRRWCAAPPPPEHGSLACHCNPPGKPSRSRLAEGSRCSVKCEHGWHDTSYSGTTTSILFLIFFYEIKEMKVIAERHDNKSMGSNTSKSTNDAFVDALKNDLDVCGNPDPRSPTPEITRTPLQNKPGSKHNITKNMDLRKTFESTKGDEKLIHNNPILSAVIKNHLQSYDPRSPTQDFERTPIVVASDIDELPDDKKMLRLQSENYASPVLRTENEHEDSCDSCVEANEKSPDSIVSRNLCAGFFDITLNETMPETEEPLGSSTASNEAIENNISKEVVNVPTKLLETNFEYIAGDSDKFEDSKDNLKDIDNTDKTDINIPVFKILNVDPRSPSIGIERTPIVVSKIDEDVSEGNVEDMSDDTLIKVLQSTNVELRQNVGKPDRNVDGLLIYEDEATDLNDTPKKSKSASGSGSRTPLSCMKNKADAAHTRSKSANMLFDPKNQKNGQTKIPKRVSHIPRLKCLTKQPKFIQTGSSVSLKNISKTAGVGGDCENTPPHSHRDRWDKDTSIVL